MSKYHYFHFPTENLDFGVALYIRPYAPAIESICSDIVNKWYDKIRPRSKIVEYKEVCGIVVPASIRGVDYSYDIKLESVKSVTFYPSRLTGLQYRHNVTNRINLMKYDYSVAGSHFDITTSYESKVDVVAHEGVCVVVYEVSFEDLIQIAVDGPMKFFR